MKKVSRPFVEEFAAAHCPVA